MTKNAGSRWGLRLLRYGLCVAAIVFLVHNVEWHDSVRLGTADGPAYRLLERRDDVLVIEADGGPKELSIAAFHHRARADGSLEPIVTPGIPGVVRGVDRRDALLALLIFAPVWLIQSYRLVLMVAIQGVRLSYWAAVKLTYAGNFFNFALPGTVGGDVVKAYYITRYTHQKTEVVTTIFLDRAIGLFSIVLLATGGILVRWDPQQFGNLTGGLAVIFGILFVGALLVFSRRLRHGLRLPELAQRLPLGTQLLRIGRATVAMRQHKLRVLVALVLSLVLQSTVMISAGVMAWALGMKGDLSFYFVYVSVGFLIAAVPIAPPQAIGVMEAFYVEFFTRAGLATASQAVALALAVRLIQFVWAIPGVLVPLLGAHLPSKADLADIEAQRSTSVVATLHPPARAD